MKYKILLATTNPSKVWSFKELLGDEFIYYTLKDLNIFDDVSETGETPLENAIIKAKFYSKFFDLVICCDQGLFFDNMPINDKRQPKTYIRRVNGKVLNDDELLNHYANIAKEFGGEILSYYIDGYAIAIRGKIFSYCDIELCKKTGFLLIDKPSPKRHKGWPLDSISIDPYTRIYLVNGGSNINSINEKKKITRENLLKIIHDN